MYFDILSTVGAGALKHMGAKLFDSGTNLLKLLAKGIFKKPKPSCSVMEKDNEIIVSLSFKVKQSQKQTK